MNMMNGLKIMESSSPMDIIGSSANSTSCSSVTNNAFSIEKSHSGLVSKKVVRIPFFWLLLMTIVVHALGTMKKLKNGFSAQYVRFGSIVTASLIENGRWN